MWKYEPSPAKIGLNCDDLEGAGVCNSEVRVKTVCKYFGRFESARVVIQETNGEQDVEE